MKKYNSIKEELEFITQKNKGICAPKDVVAFAENPETNLHKRFEWDDSKAAYEHRIWQARQIISLELIIIQKEPSENVNLELSSFSKDVRAYVSLPMDRHSGGGYRKMEDVLKDDVLRQNLLDAARNDMIQFKGKYKDLKELADVFAAIDKHIMVEVQN